MSIRTNQASIQCRATMDPPAKRHCLLNVSETSLSFEWRFAGGPMGACFYLDIYWVSPRLHTL